MERKGCCCNFLEKSKPYIAMTCLQFGYAGMNIITKVSLNRGMISHYVLVVYRNAFATALTAPFALILERKVRPKITFKIFMQLFVLGLLGPVIDQNLYYAGLKLTSPTFSCAVTNILPPITFLMAIICRMEKVEIKKLRWQAKVIGTVVITVGGGMVTTGLYKGHVINDDVDWFKGSILLVLATLAWAAFFILQAITLREFPAQISLTATVCFLGTLQSIGVTFVMERETDARWAIGWGINLLAAAYAGTISSSIAYYVQGIVMQKRGPVFVTAFSPVMMIIVAIVGFFILAENIYIVGVVGAVLVAIGLYSVLWGKYMEQKEEDDEANKIQESVKGGNNQRNAIMIIDQDIEANNNIG